METKDQSTSPVPVMRAKLHIQSVEPTVDFQGKQNGILLEARAVCPNGFDTEGNPLDESNSFARWTPTADLKMTITNPALFDKLKAGQEYYVDFTLAGEPVQCPAPIETPQE